MKNATPINRLNDLTAENTPFSRNIRWVQLAIIKTEMARCFIMYDDGTTADINVLRESVCQYLVQGWRVRTDDLISFDDDALPESSEVLQKARSDRRAGITQYK